MINEYVPRSWVVRRQSKKKKADANAQVGDREQKMYCTWGFG